jgi:hypothetical protein
VFAPVIEVHPTASAATIGSKQQLHSWPASASPLADGPIADGPIAREITFVVGGRCTWLNLWKATIDALGLLLGRTRASHDWHPLDGWINELGLQRVWCQSLGTGALIHLAAQSIGQAT